MKAHTVETSNGNNFSTIAKATAIGGVAGYLGKLWYPLTSDEMDEEFKGAMNIIKNESKKAKHKAIEDIRKIPQKTLAQDTFIKIVDANAAMKAADPLADTKSNTFKMLAKAGLNETDKIQFKNIVKAVQARAHHLHKECEKAYVNVVKGKRSTPWFVAAGAVLGFVSGIGHNILKSDV